MVIIGAGAIGMEFATVWNGYGVDVTVVEMLPHVLPLEDEEVASEVAKAYIKRGVKLLAGHKVELVEATHDRCQGNGFLLGQIKVLEAEQALVAIGFRPNFEGIGSGRGGCQSSPNAASLRSTRKWPPISRVSGLSAT